MLIKKCLAVVILMNFSTQCSEKFASSALQKKESVSEEKEEQKKILQKLHSLLSIKGLRELLESYRQNVVSFKISPPCACVQIVGFNISIARQSLVLETPEATVRYDLDKKEWQDPPRCVSGLGNVLLSKPQLKHPHSMTTLDGKYALTYHKDSSMAIKQSEMHTLEYWMEHDDDMLRLSVLAGLKKSK